jgi:alkylhydroperoxidase family enzyme
MSEIKQYEQSDKFSEREKVALRYADAILWNPELADDALWSQLHATFDEPEIVEVGYWIGFTSGGQRWLHTLHTRQGELAAAIMARQEDETRTIVGG